MICPILLLKVNLHDLSYIITKVNLHDLSYIITKVNLHDLSYIITKVNLHDLSYIITKVNLHDLPYIITKVNLHDLSYIITKVNLHDLSCIIILLPTPNVRAPGFVHPTASLCMVVDVSRENRIAVSSLVLWVLHNRCHYIVLTREFQGYPQLGQTVFDLADCLRFRGSITDHGG